MITADSKDFNALINSLKSSESAETGLMVGYKYQDKYYIYFTSKTPASEVSNKSLSTLLSTSLSIPGATYSDWAVQHAKEVARFLPGGLGILGTYSVSEEDLRLENFAYMPNAVLKLYSDITNEITLEDTLLVLHYNLLENKYCTGVVDIKNKNFNLYTDVRLTSLNKLEEVRSLYKINLEVASEGTVQNLLQKVLREWNLMLENAVFVFDQQACKDDNNISSVKPLKNYHVAEIFTKIPGFCCNSNENRVRVSGIIESIVLVHPKSTLKQVKDLLIKDMLYSLKNRLEIVSESYPIEENPFLDFPKHCLIQLPRRVIFTLSNCKLTGYTHKDIDTLQALIANLATVKPLLASHTEQIPEIIEKNQSNTQIQPQPLNYNFLISIVAIFCSVLVSFIIKNFFY